MANGNTYYNFGNEVIEILDKTQKAFKANRFQLGGVLGNDLMDDILYALQGAEKCAFDMGEVLDHIDSVKSSIDLIDGFSL